MRAERKERNETMDETELEGAVFVVGLLMSVAAGFLAASAVGWIQDWILGRIIARTADASGPAERKGKPAEPERPCGLAGPYWAAFGMAAGSLLKRMEQMERKETRDDGRRDSGN